MKQQQVAFLSGVVMISLIVAGFLAGVLGAMPTTVVTQSKSWKVLTTAFVPEAWAFFTKDPDSSALIALRSDAADITQENRTDSLPQSLNSNGLGLSRSQRSRDTEKAIYAGKVENWVDCGGMTNIECVSAAKEGAGQVIEAPKGSPHLCGAWILVQTKVVPYAYREVTPYESKAEKAAKVRVGC